jgi:hypothetical protein
MVKRGFSKRAQMQLSFGMIFSIILIILFVSFAFYAIMKLLDYQNSIKVAKFIENFEKDIDRIWKSGGSQQRSYVLPSKIEKICFIDYLESKNEEASDSGVWKELENFFYEKENLFFYPANSAKEIKARVVRNIDLGKITSEKNPFCIKNIDGKVSMTIKMSPEESLVTISE